jgi:hypothetical protein
MFSLSDVIAIVCVTSFITSFALLVVISALSMSGTEERLEEAYKRGFEEGRNSR